MRDLRSPPVVTVRLAQLEDARFVWEVNNDPIARAQSIQSAAIPWESHLLWYAQKLRQPSVLFLVGENAAEEPVGVVRFEKEADVSVISFALAAAHRARGLAAPLLGAATTAALDRGMRHVVAFVRSSNEASAKAFRRAAYELVGHGSQHGVEMLRFEHIAPGER